MEGRPEGDQSSQTAQPHLKSVKKKLTPIWFLKSSSAYTLNDDHPTCNLEPYPSLFCLLAAWVPYASELLNLTSDHQDAVQSSM